MVPNIDRRMVDRRLVLEPVQFDGCQQRIRITGSIQAASLTLLAACLATYFVFPRGTLPRIFFLIFIITNRIGMTHWRIIRS